MSALTRDEKRLVESHLRRYVEYKDLVKEYRAGGSSTKAGPGKSNLPGKPTEQRAIASIEPPRRVRDAETWVRVYEMTLDRLPTYKREVMERLFLVREKPIDIAEDMSIELPTFYRWRQDILQTFALCAVQEKAMKIHFKNYDKKSAF